MSKKLDPRAAAAYASLTAADDAVANAAALRIAAYREHAPTIESCRAKSGPMLGQLTRLAEIMHAEGRSKSVNAAKVAIGRWAAVGRLLIAQPDASDECVVSMIVIANVLTGREVDALISYRFVVRPGMTGADARTAIESGGFESGGFESGGSKSGGSKSGGSKSGKRSKNQNQNQDQDNQDQGADQGADDSREHEGEEITVQDADVANVADALATFAEWGLYMVEIATEMTAKEYKQFLDIMSATRNGVKENRKAA